MLFFIRSDGSVVLQAGETSTLTQPVQTKQGGTPAVGLQFLSDAGLIYQPDASPNAITSLKFIGKKLGDYYGAPVISNYVGAPTNAYVYVASGALTTAIYTVNPSFSTGPLLQLLIAPETPAATPANITARYALTGLTNGAIVLQLDTSAYWTLTTSADISSSAGWTAGVFFGEPADQTARYALTGIANGTMVLQVDTGIPWIVIDNTNLANSAGWSADVPIVPEGFVDLGCQVELNVNGGAQVLESASFTMRVTASYITGTEGVQLSVSPSYPAPGQLALDTSATIASASTTDIGAANAGALTVTGTTTINAFDTVAAGLKRFLTFAGALTLTYNATSMILPTAASIATAAGDCAVFESLGSGNWKCLSYQRVDGGPAGLTLVNRTLGSGCAASGSTCLDYSGGAESLPMPKALVRQAMLSGTVNTWDLGAIQKVTNSATIAISQARYAALSLAATAGAYAEIVPWGAGADFVPYTPDGTGGQGDLRFNKPYFIQLTFTPSFQTSTTILRVSLTTSGGLFNAGSTPPWALQNKGIGFQVTYNSSAVLNVQSYVHNGSALTNTTAGTVPNTGAPIQIFALFDGAGNWTLWANGALLGTGTGAPTAAATGDNSHFMITYFDPTNATAQVLAVADVKLGWL